MTPGCPALTRTGAGLSNPAAPGDALGALIQIEVLRALRELRTDHSVALAPYDAWDEAEDAGDALGY